MAGEIRVVVVGGGAAGFFAAISCAEKLGGRGTVTLLEATAHPLAKVRVSGGGRCNVTHACFEPRELVKKYPRGGRELLGAFSRFQPRDTVAWFAARGVELKTEPDGRMFPVTDDSATIVECLTRAAEQAGVKVITSLGVRTVERSPSAAGTSSGSAFWLTLTDDSNLRCERLLIATAGNRSSAGLTIAGKLGHSIEPPVPSLFTFHIDDKRLEGLSGVSVSNATAAVSGTKLRENGPLLITHWGLSGPAILKLSAWGARELAKVSYEFPVTVNFTGSLTREALLRELTAVREKNPRKQITTWSPLDMPQRLWERLVTSSGIAAATPWAQVGNAALGSLAGQLTGAEFKVVGKSLFKEEFVTCGGVSTILSGYVTMTGGLAGHQWNEGDVSCSVVRRVALPDSFYAIDGLLETFLTILRQMEVFPAAIAAENERNLPFLATTTILMEAVKRGAGRETAHEAIKEHALAAAKALRSGGGDADLLTRLAADKRIGLGKKALQAILSENSRFVGAAPHQVDAFLAEVKPIAKKHKGAIDYRPARLL